MRQFMARIKAGCEFLITFRQYQQQSGAGLKWGGGTLKKNDSSSSEALDSLPTHKQTERGGLSAGDGACLLILTDNKGLSIFSQL